MPRYRFVTPVSWTVGWVHDRLPGEGLRRRRSRRTSAAATPSTAVDEQQGRREDGARRSRTSSAAPTAPTQPSATRGARPRPGGTQVEAASTTAEKASAGSSHATAPSRPGTAPATSAATSGSAGRQHRGGAQQQQPGRGIGGGHDPPRTRGPRPARRRTRRRPPARAARRAGRTPARALRRTRPTARRSRACRRDRAATTPAATGPRRPAARRARTARRGTARAARGVGRGACACCRIRSHTRSRGCRARRARRSARGTSGQRRRCCSIDAPAPHRRPRQRTGTAGVVRVPVGGHVSPSGQVEPQMRLGAVQAGLHGVLRYAEQPAGLPGGQAVQDGGLHHGAHLRGQPEPAPSPGRRTRRRAAPCPRHWARVPRQSRRPPDGRARASWRRPRKPGHEPPDGDAPEPGAHLTVAAPPLGALHTAEEGVLQDVGDRLGLVAPAAQPGRQPRGVPVVENAQRAAGPRRPRRPAVRGHPMRVCAHT